MATITPTLSATKRAATELPRLNVGSGPIQPAGWINIDNSNRAKLVRYLPWLDWLLVKLRVLLPAAYKRGTRTDNICRRLRFPDNSVAVVYAGEVLEHFTEVQAEQFLAECYRVLAPGGVLRIRVPDNHRFWKNYVAECESSRQLPREKWNLEHTRWVRMFFRDICTKRVWLRSMGHFHKWMYDEISLILALEKAGFVEVERHGLHHSRISEVHVVETHEDLTVEGIKRE